MDLHVDHVDFRSTQESENKKGRLTYDSDVFRVSTETRDTGQFDKKRNGMFMIGLIVTCLVVVTIAVTLSITIPKHAADPEPCFATIDSHPSVHLKNGINLVGQVDNENKVYIYNQVPYALPPTSDERFMPPKNIPRLQSSSFEKNLYWSSNSTAPNCYAADIWELGSASQDESCLFLTIYTPIEKTNQSGMKYSWFKKYLI